MKKLLLARIDAHERYSHALVHAVTIKKPEDLDGSLKLLIPQEYRDAFVRKLEELDHEWTEYEDGECQAH